MEIITPRTDTHRQVTCPHCGAVIGYYETEVEYWVVPPTPGRFTPRPGIGFDHIECPSCDGMIRLDSSSCLK